MTKETYINRLREFPRDLHEGNISYVLMACLSVDIRYSTAHSESECFSGDSEPVRNLYHLSVSFIFLVKSNIKSDVVERISLPINLAASKVI
jgi:hypothetical protein